MQWLFDGRKNATCLVPKKVHNAGTETEGELVQVKLERKAVICTAYW
jgi:hypothetical protein